MAIVLVGTLVVPLATGIQLATNRAEGLRDRSEALYADGSTVDGSEAWTWGATVESATWEAGPVLRVDVRQDTGAAGAVGLWVDGWHLGEWETDSSGTIAVGPAEWSGRTGSELVIRARGGGGCWGPPWRSFVPDSYCQIVGDRASRDFGPSLSGGVPEWQLVAHVPALGNPSLYATWTDGPFGESVLGLTYLLPLATGGYCELGLDGDSQSWGMEEGRALDVYF
jgi:hypothetical protein